MTYTPSTNAGTHTINASYGGSTTHAASSDPDGVRAHRHQALDHDHRDLQPGLGRVRPGLDLHDGRRRQRLGHEVVPDRDRHPERGACRLGDVQLHHLHPGPDRRDHDLVLRRDLHAFDECGHAHDQGLLRRLDDACGELGSRRVRAHRHQALDLDHRDLRPASVAGQASTCTTVVADTDSGTKSFPTGTVTLERGACRLGDVQLRHLHPGPDRRRPRPRPATSATRPPTNAGTHTIKGSYGGSTTHAMSSDPTGSRSPSPSARPRPPSSCSPASSHSEPGFDLHGDRHRHRRGRQSRSRRARSPSRCDPTPRARCSAGHLHAGPDGLAPATRPRELLGTLHAPDQRGHAHDQGLLRRLDDACTSSDPTAFAITVTKRTTSTTRDLRRPRRAVETVPRTRDGLRHRRGRRSRSRRAPSAPRARRRRPGTFPSGATCTLAPVGADHDLELLGHLHARRPTPARTRSRAPTAARRRHARALTRGFALTVTKRTTSTAVSCSPARSPSTSGSLHGDRLRHRRRHQVRSRAGSVSFTLPSGDRAPCPGGTSCTLAQAGAPDTSSCSVSYTPDDQRRHAHDQGRLRRRVVHARDR